MISQFILSIDGCCFRHIFFISLNVSVRLSERMNVTVNQQFVFIECYCSVYNKYSIMLKSEQERK